MENNSLEVRVENALESIRPFLNKDGGDIELIKIEDTVVYVKLLGNCSGCPVSFSTMKLGVENTVKEKVPEITRVENVE
ncbi:NifU family protein [Riemerella anatipestifer]|uniref:Nitrogen-fixing nifu domain protein n=1 Tax=Riemerella anatipestifer (strain ATCC 11845 / DSM 15868 / JCM 9532 / NCTC 11014) TaxID=693978 RepID=E4TBS1_RIEAD|nr:NifU family protein [Riemerella anatipestifer]ADQ81968.1 nitrogen-fixing NifU domain protein [Riemerella anatipestifer ATCC 11845 = DSM 15868]ADZ12534.1 Thioredoxin-like protein [Riemerella anatipestifer RA-GD]AFD55973.1 nitrogen-fixing nifu domain protein [Riemerella anatipestifer ATCC 11845 = DSM 15868]AGC40122.1 Thioredoxin-like protein and domains [Riemerella anatipestifer RA-CH-2]AKP69194.1 nitrogen-fixing nifu domain-containing protein [Riemerella anatipestifer]